MDPDRFDALTRALSTAASSRRRLLTGVTGGSLGTLLGLRALEDVGASHFNCGHVGKPCTRRS
jgi:hypothetical protein